MQSTKGKTISLSFPPIIAYATHVSGSKKLADREQLCPEQVYASHSTVSAEWSGETPFTDLAHHLDDRHHIVLGEGVVQRADAQDEAAMQERPVHKRLPASLPSMIRLFKASSRSSSPRIRSGT